jgi:hypothetical protein
MSENMSPRADRALWALWVPGLLVAVGAGVATAHGLYEVAVAAAVPRAIAWLYPLITDGLALVAYASTARLAAGGRTYAWTVVVLAAGLSGVAQASYLAGGVGTTPATLRFGIGAWPAVAAAIVAHLLFLLGHDSTAPAEQAEISKKLTHAADSKDELASTVELPAVDTTRSPSSALVVQPKPARPVQPAVHPPAQPEKPRPVKDPGAPKRPTRTGEPSPRDRARAAARHHEREHGDLPTVSALMAMTDVSRGTAGNALKELREQRGHLHIVDSTQQAKARQ